MKPQPKTKLYDIQQYNGPTVGEKLQIYETQLEIARDVLEDIKELSGDPAVIRKAVGALNHLDFESRRYDKKPREMKQR